MKTYHVGKYRSSFILYTWLKHCDQEPESTPTGLCYFIFMDRTLAVANKQKLESCTGMEGKRKGYVCVKSYLLTMYLKIPGQIRTAGFRCLNNALGGSPSGSAASCSCFILQQPAPQGSPACQVSHPHCFNCIREIAFPRILKKS